MMFPFVFGEKCANIMLLNHLIISAVMFHFISSLHCWDVALY